MNEWGVVGVIIAMAGFVISVVTPIIKLNTTITKLTTIVDEIAKDFDMFTSKNSTAHEKMFEELGDHEKRITVLETTTRRE